MRFCFFTHVWVLLCLNMFHSYVPCFCHLSIPVCSCRLSRVIHQHISSLLAGIQFTVCMTSPHRHFCFGFNRQLDFCQFIYVWVWICLNMFHSNFSFVCNLSILVCSHRVSRSTIDRQPKGSAPLSWCARAMQIPICLLENIHVCLTQFRFHPQVTSTEVKTYLHTPTIALRLYS